MPQKDKYAIAEKQIKKIVACTIAINIILTAVKLFVGISAGAISLIADGIHSFSDMATDAAVIVGVKIGAKKPDDNHPYGHQWAETFTAAFVAAVLGAAGGYMIFRSLKCIVEKNVSHIGIPVLSVAILSIVCKELAFGITKKAAVKFSSSMLYANAWHHRSDALSSVAVAAGAVFSMFGFKYADQSAALIVGIMIIFVAAKIMADCLGQFTAKAVNAETSEKIKAIIAAQSRIKGYHKLRTRTVGRELFMDLHILVDANLNITQAHDIAEELENTLHKSMPQPVNITVHIEPADSD